MQGEDPGSRALPANVTLSHTREMLQDESMGGAKHHTTLKVTKLGPPKLLPEPAEVHEHHTILTSYRLLKPLSLQCL